MKQPVKAFIFDIDGTLLDSNDAHARCLQQGFAEVGYSFEFQQIRSLIGMGLDQIIPRLTALSPESPTGKKIAEVKDRCFSHVFDMIRPFPRATELVATLHRRGYLVTVATSASGDDLKKFLKKLEIEDYLIQPASSDDADQSKPHPDLIQAALRNLKLPPEATLMVGDTPYDITAAERAGVRTLALRTGGWSDDSLHRALAIYDHPAQLLEAIEREHGTTIAL
jgi:phosphoglycolate phosphatase-like HAD superfamily hydrolase